MYTQKDNDYNYITIPVNMENYSSSDSTCSTCSDTSYISDYSDDSVNDTHTNRNSSWFNHFYDYINTIVDKNYDNRNYVSMI